MIKLIHFLKPYKKVLMLVFVFIFIQALGTLYIPTLTAFIVNDGVAKGDINYIIKMGLIMLITAGITGVVTVLGAWLSSNVSSGFAKDIREAMFIKAQELSLNDFNKVGTASMITRTTNDITLIGQTVLMFIQMLLPAPIMAIGGLILAFSKDKVIALIIVGTMVAFILVAIFLGKKAIPMFMTMQSKMDNINGKLRERIIGVRVIRAFNREKSEKRRIDSAATDYANNAIKINKVIAILIPIVMMIMNLGVILILWIGGIRVLNGNMHIGDIMAMAEYCFLILYFLMMGAMMFMYIPRAQACAQRINEVLEINPEILDGKVKTAESTEYAHVKFKNVTFQYHDAEEAVLSNLSFEAKSGEVTAIIGGTGSGKSTIANLIPRFYDIQSGSIMVDGIDIKTMSQKELRDKIGLVPQKAFLFSGTIVDNIRFGKKTATDKDIEHAAKVAQAHDFITSLEGGYNFHVAQGGNNLSGGQKQRLSIARALIRKPEIYIFDDSFSALDFKTDLKLRKALKSEVGSSSIIIVAQRISTIMDAHRIIVLEDGKIAGVGSHEELMKNCDVYRQIAASQLSEAELA